MNSPPTHVAADVRHSIRVNGVLRALSPDCTTIADLIRDMKLEGKRIAVEQNGAIVPRTRYADCALGPDDKVEIVGAVGGG